ncbi:MAG TPA: PilZ domain-containing protein [Pseudomonadales bacterium]
MNMRFDENGIVYSGCLPLSLVLMSGAPHEHELLRANEGNELLLRSVSALEEKIDTDENDEIAQELRRQDMKLNLVLDLLGALLLQQQVIPESRELQLSAAGLRTHVSPTPAPAQHCRLQLYIEPAIPKPLTLFGQCHASSGPGMTDISFTGLSQTVTDNLDKFIFRHHRRRIAQARHAG